MYCKFRLVDTRTNRLPKSENVPLGMPTIEGLTPLFYVNDKDVLWFYASHTQSDLQSVPGIEVIADEQWDTLVALLHAQKLEAKILEAYNKAKEVRASVSEKWYHPTEIIAGRDKYDEAVSFLNAADKVAKEAEMLAGPTYTLAHESVVRGVPLEELANAVVAHYNQMRELDAKLAGIRGKKVDQLQAVVFTGVDSFKKLDMIDLESGWTE